MRPHTARRLAVKAFETQPLVSGAVGVSTVGTLFTRARDGDRAAAEALIRELSGLVVATVRRCGVPSHSVEDVASSVWLRLFEKQHTIREPAAVPGWLQTTARNEAMQWHRARGRETPTSTGRTVDDGVHEQGYLDFEDDEEMSARRRRLRAVWDRIDRRCRELLGLKTQTPPLTNAQVADEMGMPIGSVGPTYMRCLDKLRVVLGEASA